MVLVCFFLQKYGWCFLSFYFPPASLFQLHFPGLLPEGLLEKYFIYQELKLLNLLKLDMFSDSVSDLCNCYT